MMSNSNNHLDLNPSGNIIKCERFEQEMGFIPPVRIGIIFLRLIMSGENVKRRKMNR